MIPINLNSNRLDTIRERIAQARLDAVDDESFIADLNGLVRRHGEHVCPYIFNSLAALELPVDDAVSLWTQLQTHRLELAATLGREIGIVTALSDLLDQTGRGSHAQLIDTRVLERAVRGTTHDYLTGLCNRTYFDETYEQQVNFAKRYNSHLSVLFLDIDDFKEINDSIGHIAGDLALKTVAGIINNAKRNSDISARFGGEEFVLLMPHTSSDNAYNLAERIRKEIEQTTLTFNVQRFSLTISGGLASYPQHSTDPGDLLVMADSALYLAKGAGKNAIALFKKEKRRYLRMKLQQPILAQELGFKNNNIYPGTSMDIGMGGILFECETPIPLGTMLKVNVPVHGANPLLLIGRVVRTDRVGKDRFHIGMSISFKEMAKEANSGISNFLRGESPIGDLRSSGSE